MDAKVTWQQGLSFNATAESGFEVRLGAAKAVGGANDGFRPLELMLMSLLGCTGMDVISILQKKRQPVTNFRVTGHAEQADQHPSVFTRAILEYHVTGNGVDEAAVRRAIELSALRYCPAQNMLNQVMPIQLLYFIYLDEEDGAALTAQGEYIPPQE